MFAVEANRACCVTAGVAVEFYPYKQTTPGLKTVLGTVGNALPWKSVKIELRDGTSFSHVVPADDDRYPHYLDDFCLCLPRVDKLYDDDQFVGLMWVHNSWDGREYVEGLSAQPML